MASWINAMNIDEESFDTFLAEAGFPPPIPIKIETEAEKKMEIKTEAEMKIEIKTEVAEEHVEQIEAAKAVKEEERTEEKFELVEVEQNFLTPEEKEILRIEDEMVEYFMTSTTQNIDELYRLADNFKVLNERLKAIGQNQHMIKMEKLDNLVKAKDLVL